MKKDSFETMIYPYDQTITDRIKNRMNRVSIIRRKNWGERDQRRKDLADQ